MEHWIHVNNTISGGKGIVFLDRDGVIIQDKHYLSNPSKVELRGIL